MPLKLLYITNDPQIAKIAEKNGVDRIMVDMEYIGKELRQGSLDSVKNHHTEADICTIRAAIEKAQLVVRINPVHEAGEEYGSSEEEINGAIRCGADVLMLPYFKTVAEVKRFLACVNGRCRTILLLETKEAVEALDDILALPGVEEIHIGLNDLSISCGRSFLFELLTDGTVERICWRIRKAGIPYGFGGIASLGRGDVPAEMIIREHYRLGSHGAILSRSFCNVNKIDNLEAAEEIFFRGVREIRTLEKECAAYRDYFENNRRELRAAVAKVVDKIKAKQTLS